MKASALLGLLLFISGVDQPNADAQSTDRVVFGRVTGPGGNPTADALVQWGPFRAMPEDRQSTISDERGNYRMIVDKVGPDYRLGISAAGRAPVWHDAITPKRAHEAEPVDIVLKRGHAIEGVVVDHDGNPVSGLSVSVMTPGHGFRSSFSSYVEPTPLPGPGRTVMSAEDGRFVFSDLPDNEVGIRVMRDGRHAGRIRNHPVDQPARVLVSSAADRDGEIRVRVVDASSGEPVDTCSVILRHRTEAHLPQKGVVTIPGLRTGDHTYQTHVYSGSHQPKRLKLSATPAANNIEQRVALESGTPFRGQLVDASTGTPIANTEMICSEPGRSRYIEWGQLDDLKDGMMDYMFVRRVVTRQDGTFEVGEGDRRTQFIVLCPGYARTIFQPHRRPEPDDEGRVQLALRPEAVVSGVLIADGEPRPGFQVHVTRLRPRGILEHNFEWLHVEEAGRFRYGNLAPGTHILSSTSVQGNGSVTYWFGRRFEIGPGEHKALNLGDDLGPHTVTGITGPWVEMRMIPEFDWEYRTIGTVAGPDGEFRIPGLRPGAYTLHVHTSSSAMGSFFHSSYPVTIHGDTHLDIAELRRSRRAEQRTPHLEAKALTQKQINALIDIELSEEEYLRQQEIVAWIEERGGTVWYAHQFNEEGNIIHREARPDLMEPLGDTYREPVVSVILGTKGEFSNDSLQMVRDLVHLRNLSLRDTRVTSEGLRHLGGLDSLESIGLTFTDTDDDGLKALSELPNLRELMLQRTKITDGGLVYLTKLKKLERLRLYDTNITDAGLNHLAKIRSLRELKVERTRVTDEGVRAFMKAVPEARVYPQVTPADELAHFGVQ